MPTERKNEAIWIESRNRWQINVQCDGKRRTFTCSTQGKKGKITAEKKADAWLETNSSNENVRFKDLYANFLEDAAKNKGSSTVDQHFQNGKHYILPTIGLKKAAKLTQQDYQNCINFAYQKKLSKKTLQNIRGSLTAVFKYAKKNRIPLEYPSDLEIPKDAPVKQKRIIQPDKLQFLFTQDTISKRGKEIPFFYIYAIRFFVVMGLRRGELCGLRKEDFTAENVYQINRSVNRFNEITPGKNENANRLVVVPEIGMQILKQQETMLKNLGIISPWIFPNEFGNMTEPNALSRNWDIYKAQHGLDCSIHELRHTMISITKNSVPEAILKQIVGHSQTMDTFGIYGHTVDGELAQGAAIINQTFQKILG